MAAHRSHTQMPDTPPQSGGAHKYHLMCLEGEGTERRERGQRGDREERDVPSEGWGGVVRGGRVVRPPCWSFEKEQHRHRGARREHVRVDAPLTSTHRCHSRSFSYAHLCTAFLSFFSFLFCNLFRHFLFFSLFVIIFVLCLMFFFSFFLPHILPMSFYLIRCICSR